MSSERKIISIRAKTLGTVTYERTLGRITVNETAEVLYFPDFSNPDFQQVGAYPIPGKYWCRHFTNPRMVETYAAGDKCVEVLARAAKQIPVKECGELINAVLFNSLRYGLIKIPDHKDLFGKNEPTYNAEMTIDDDPIVKDGES